MPLKPGTLNDFDHSMAADIELELEALMRADGAPALNKDASDATVRDRRRFLVAIARGVVRHLHAHQGDITVRCEHNKTKPISVSVNWT
jgi:hypothetical protein